jgi:hypothetical protein
MYVLRDMYNVCRKAGSAARVVNPPFRVQREFTVTALDDVTSKLERVAVWK